MKFMEILQTLARTTVEHHPELIPLVLAARVELFRLTQLKADLEDPDMVFERWALHPNRGVKHELENSKTLKYGNIHLNAAHIGFMQCYAWLQPKIEALQAKVAAGTNTPDVLQNDKITFHFAKLSDAESMNVEGPAGPLTELLKNAFCDVYPKTVGFKDPSPSGEEPATPLDTQVGGSHYTEMAIQPLEFSMLNNLDPCQHTAIKYIARFRQKDGIADLDKAIHTIELLKHFESSK